MVHAHRAERARCTLLGVAAGGAGAADAEVANREVVLHGVGRIEGAEASGDLLGGPPGGVVAGGEAEVPGDAVDVDVDGDHQGGSRDGPEAEIDSVFGTAHPPEVEEEALA